jgi:mannan endo-1,4-beta-mannosidase
MKLNTNLRKSFTTLIYIFFCCISSAVYSQTFFNTNGNKIIDPCGNDFIMRGINYSLADDWNFPGNLNNGRELSSQIILANPNTVRVQWYVDYGQPSRPALTLAALDSVISRFSRAGIATVLELHDFTHIHTDTTAFNTKIVGWWTSQPVLELIDKHKLHLFLNVANEYGPAMYPAPNYTLNQNYNSQITTWVTHYKNVITRLRNAGIEIPIMIDAPNYGMDYNSVINHGATFVNHDPLHRIIMSCHAYWGTTPEATTQVVNQLAMLPYPLVFGEVGNVDFSCESIQLYKHLEACQDKGMGWLAWTWNRDECPTRNMTENDPGYPPSPIDGLFSTLTTYGQLIVNNADFGLANHAEKAEFSCPLGIETIENKVNVYPNPVNSVLNISIDQAYQTLGIAITDINGRIALVEHELQQIDVSGLNKGIYFVQVSIDGKETIFKVVK